MGIRARTGPRKGELEWHPCLRMMVHEVLKNPLYAGAYAYGRRKVDPRRRIAGRPGTGKIVVDLQDCEVFLKDRFPDYISWEQYESHREQLRRNRSVADSMGSVRQGTALLSGLLICKKCGHRMHVRYKAVGNNPHQYWCNRILTDHGADQCPSLAGPALDRFVTEQMLAMLKPTSLSLSLEAARDLEKERQRLDDLWQKRLERARYASERAQRQYSLVEPENRLVARQLEREWEEELKQQKSLEMEYERFLAQRPRLLTEEERETIMRLAADIPALWNDEATTVAERKEILRQIIDKIIIDAREKTERVKVSIHWAGGMVSELEMIRPVAKTEKLSYYPEMIERIKLLAMQGLGAAQIAEELNQEGWRPPKRSERFNYGIIAALMRRLRLGKWQFSRGKDRIKIGQDEWWLPELAGKLDMPVVTLYRWICVGRVKARKHENRQWIIWADPSEIERLRQLRAESIGTQNHRRWLEKASINKDN